MPLKTILLATIFISIPLESTIFSIPIFFTLSVLAYFLYPDSLVITLVFAASLIADSLRLGPLGMTGIVTLGTFFVIELLRREVTFSDYKSILIFLFVSTYIYARFFAFSDSLITYLLIFSVCFGMFYFLGRNRKSDLKVKFE